MVKVAKKRGQILVNWNFAYALPIVFSHTLLTFRLFRTGDADWNPLPPTAEVQKASFDDFLATKPHSMISLQHENYGTCKPPTATTILIYLWLSLESTL